MLGSLTWMDVVREGIIGCLLMLAMEEVMFRGMMLHRLESEGQVFAMVVIRLATGWLFAYMVLKHGDIRYALPYIIILLFPCISCINMPFFLTYRQERAYNKSKFLQ